MAPRAIAIMAILCTAVEAQQYFEASGSTRVFTLTARAKAGPAAVATVNGGAARAALSLVISVRHDVCISASGAPARSRVSVYNVAGKKVAQVLVDARASVSVSKILPNGIYFARLENNRRALLTTSFRIVR